MMKKSHQRNYLNFLNTRDRGLNIVAWLSNSVHTTTDMKRENMMQRTKEAMGLLTLTINQNVFVLIAINPIVLYF